MADQIFIDGEGTYDTYGLILTEASEEPPEPKIYTVDVPGGDGQIDLSEFGGDLVYSNRNMTYTFLLTSREKSKIEGEKTKLSKLWHGKNLPFTLSWDTGYTYTGRITIDKYPNNYRYGTITLKISAKPYKFYKIRTLLVNAAGGVTVSIENGRKRVCPTIEVQHTTLVAFEGETYTLEPGTYKIKDLWFRGGTNEMVLNSYPEYNYATWEYYTGKIWADYADKLLSVLCAGDQPLQAYDRWINYSGKTWWDLEGKTWMDLSHPATSGDKYSVYIQYDIYEL